MSHRFPTCSAPAATLAVAVALIAAFSALPAGAETPAVPAAPAPAEVRVTLCKRGSTPAERRVEFRGAMSRVPRTARMWMRVTLQERVPEGRFTTVHAPGLGVWRKSREGMAGFAYRQRVVDLAQGSHYRAAVHYRWYSKDGERLRSARRISSACRQAPFPNLRVASIEGARVQGSPGTVRYVVRVANDGRATATGVAVSLAVDGGVIDTPVVGTIAPGEVRRAVVNGPPCQSSLEAVADPAGVVRESFESDNVRAAACPPTL
ncbi:MAG: CARDB domain-containing protein [Actinomycetota bacterium]